jgi:hypothetical protein
MMTISQCTSVRGVLLLGVLFGMWSCSADSKLKPFTSDGCSLFPDSSLISENDWCSCCFEHDISYWKGGTDAERKTADEVLRDCVAGKTGNTTLANAMYDGVRLGGSPYFYNWYRWGYGWDYSRKYQALTAAETDRADQLLADYFAADGERVCD